MMAAGGGTRTGSAGPDVLVIVEEFMQATARDAVVAAHGTVMGCVRWHDAPERLAQQSLVDVVLAEARGADDALLAHALPRLDAMSRRGDARIVVTFDVEQIVLVVANLGDPEITLLCDPSPAERFVAVYVAGAAGSPAAVHDAGREAEASRLRRLNEEVARIAETLAQLTRGDGMRERERHAGFARGAVGEAGRPYRGPPIPSEASDITAHEIREAIRARRLRDQFFGGGLFEDPAWDMLLDLFAAELERAEVSVSSLCIAAAVAPTTALRWIGRMTEAGLFERHPDPFDRRRAFMALSDRASAAMRDYVAALRRAGLALA